MRDCLIGGLIGLIVGCIFSMIIIIAGGVRTYKSDAQIVCELSHSADVCFQALNR